MARSTRVPVPRLAPQRRNNLRASDEEIQRIPLAHVWPKIVIVYGVGRTRRAGEVGARLYMARFSWRLSEFLLNPISV